MAPEIIIRVKCEPYLIKFLETLYGASPISFPKNSNFNMFLDVFLEKPPFNYTEPDYGDKTLTIILPCFDVKDIRSYNYLSPSKQHVFIKEIWKFFKVEYRKFISKCIVMGLDRKDAMTLFMKEYDLSQECWDLLEKDYQRHQSARRKKRLFRKKINSSL